MQFNNAKAMYADLMGMPDHPEASLSIAVEQTALQVESYKAPHAYRGTPARPRYPRGSRNLTVFSNADNTMVVRKPRLFKGHRP